MHSLLGLGFALYSVSALAAGAGTAVPALPVIAPVMIDEISGCQRGKAQEMARKQCGDYDVANLRHRDGSVNSAYEKCLAFYESALRVQNVFCSYRMDAVVFQAIAVSTSAGSEVGNSNVSEETVARDNQGVTKITKAYIERLTELAPKFRANYEAYESAIGKLNGGGGTDEFYESTCASSLVTGTVPGYMRELLATQSHSNATMTNSSMWKAIRENVKSLQAVKAQAEENAKLAQFRAIDVGSVFQKEVEAPTPAEPKRPLTPMEGATAGAWQYLFSETMQKIAPKIPAAGAAVIGGGVVLIYQIATNKMIQYPETAATFIGMLNPVVGIAANVVVAVGRTMQANLIEYRKFAKEQLSRNMTMTSMQLVDAWGKFKKNDKCVKNAADETNCIEKRKTMLMYEVNSCSRSSILGNGSQAPQSTITNKP